MPSTIFTGTVVHGTTMPSSPISTGVTTASIGLFDNVTVLFTVTAPSGTTGAFTARLQATWDNFAADSDCFWRNVDDDFAITPVASATVSDKTSWSVIRCPGATRLRVFGMTNTDASKDLTVRIDVVGSTGVH